MGQISRLLGRPKCLSRREDEWHDWSPKFCATAATLSDHASVWMSGALQHTTEITLDQPDEASVRIFARQMYTLLIHLREGRALAIVRGAPDHDGLEAWRLLHEWYQPKTRSRGLSLLSEILGWDFGTKEQFLKEIRTYVHVHVREETVKLSHVRQLLCDCALERRGRHHAQRNLLKRTLQTSCRWMLTPCTVKVANGRRKARVKAKTRVNRPRHDGKGKGEQSVKQRYIDGYCNQCGEHGHKKPDCAGKNTFFYGTCKKCAALGHKRVDCRVKTVALLESESVIEPKKSN